MKVQVNDKVIKIAEGYIKVIDGRLKNFNTGRDEGIEGDVVEYRHGNKWYKGHVVGYTYSNRRMGPSCFGGQGSSECKLYPH